MQQLKKGLSIFFLIGILALSIAIQAAPTLRANGKIAFTSDRDGNSEIYLMNADGTNQTRLTESPDREDYPTWSPDGRRIAFLKHSKGIFSINLMDADGTNQSELTRIVPNNIQAYPYERFGLSWSPDGSKIAFQDGTDIFTIDIDGRNRFNLTRGQYINYEPSWSADSSQIVFSRSIYFHGFYPQVYTMDKNGGNIARITYCEVYCENRSPVWSPDGGRIAIEDQGEDNLYTSLVDPDGTNVQHLPYGTKPKWSPDGTKFVFYRHNYSSPYISHVWVMDKDGSRSTQLTNSSPNNFHPDWQPLVVNVSNIDELYSAINNPANAGANIVVAPGVYMLSVKDTANIPRPNGGRLELQENMSLLGVAGDRSSVVIDAANLPASSYDGEIPGTGTIRMGRGNNAIEWLTVTNAQAGGGGIIAHLSAPGTTHIRVAHVASLHNPRGIDIRNVNATSTAYVIDADIIDNDFADSPVQGLRIINFDGANGGSITARFRDNRSRGNREGLLIVNRNSSFSSISVTSSRDRFYENGAGAIILCGFSGSSVSNGNTCNITAKGTSFDNNNGPSSFDIGGLIVVGGENLSFPDGTSNNTVQVNLSGCPIFRNQSPDIGAWGARSNPASIGSPGTNNHVTIYRSNPGSNRVKQTLFNSVPELPGLMNTVSLIDQ